MQIDDGMKPLPGAARARFHALWLLRHYFPGSDALRDPADALVGSAGSVSELAAAAVAGAVSSMIVGAAAGADRPGRTG